VKGRRLIVGARFKDQNGASKVYLRDPKAKKLFWAPIHAAVEFLARRPDTEPTLAPAPGPQRRDSLDADIGDMLFGDGHLSEHIEQGRSNLRRWFGGTG
jgi:hypothetical protein